MAATEPTVLDVRIHLEVPPSVAEATLKGDANGRHLFTKIAKNKAAELLPRFGLRPEDHG